MSEGSADRPNRIYCGAGAVGAARDLAWPEDGLTSHIALRVGVVVVNYGSAALIERSLSQLTAGGYDALRVHPVIVDNFSSSSERERIVELCRRMGWELISMPNNAGFGTGMSIGIDHAFADDCDTVLMLNPDAWIDCKNLYKLASLTLGSGDMAVSPIVLHPDGRTWFEGATILWARGLARHATRGDPASPWLTAACLMISRQAWQSVRPFDPDYFLYWEDVDLTFRIGRERLRIAHDVEAFHDPGGTQGGRGKSETYMFFVARNRLVFASKNLGVLQQFVWAVTTPLALISLWRMTRGEARNRRWKLALASFRGAVAGFEYSVAHFLSRSQHRSPRGSAG